MVGRSARPVDREADGLNSVEIESVATSAEVEVVYIYTEYTYLHPAQVAEEHSEVTGVADQDQAG